MDKNIFLRKDWNTYKPKFKLLCQLCAFNIEKFAYKGNSSYISRIEIKEKELL